MGDDVMKVYITVDMEGVSGVTHNQHTSETGNDYSMARQLMTAETNAAIEGAFEAGATEVVVNDAHGGNGERNLLLRDLHREARLLTGRPKDLSQMAGVDASFDAALLVGYHVRANSLGVIAHTIKSPFISELRINGKPVGEIGTNAYVAGHFGVPVALVTGDQHTAEEALDLMPWIETAVVKESVAYTAALCLHPEKARQLIKEKTITALRRLEEMEPLMADVPVTFDVEAKDEGMVEMAAWGIPGWERVGPRHLRFVSDSLATAYRSLITVIYLGMPHVR